jgi:hypothetical protein
MPQIVGLDTSPRKNKRLRVHLDDGNYYDFGYDKGSTYIDHHDKKKRENYRNRHYAMEAHLIDNYIPSPSLFSYYLLWGNSTDIIDNIMELNKHLTDEFIYYFTD